MLSEYRRSTEETWDAIAESFDTTRRTPWKQCLDFIDTLKNTDIVADVGCGNGRHLVPCAEHCRFVIGTDISRKMLTIVQNTLEKKHIRNVSLIHADVVKMPVKDASFNAIMCIASLHNVRGKEPRSHAVKEIFRMLTPDGIALVSVWSRWQEKYWRFFTKQYFFRTEEFGDIDIYWRQHDLNIPRFYHLYSKKEFIQELQQAGFIIRDIQSVKLHSKRFPDNYFAIVQKKIII
jgi:alkylated DNA repair protein alkB family protein 8